MTPRHATHDTATPTAGAPTVSRKGVTIPWAWIAGLAPTAALGGALGHAQLFGAPPEYSQRLDDHERRITQLDKSAALDHAAQERIAEDIRRILAILENRKP
jgi:hypothetical protein